MFSNHNHSLCAPNTNVEVQEGYTTIVIARFDMSIFEKLHKDVRLS